MHRTPGVVERRCIKMRPAKPLALRDTLAGSPRPVLTFVRVLKEGAIVHVFLGFPFNLGKAYRQQVKAICAKRALDLRAADDHFHAVSIWDDIQEDIDTALFAVFDLTNYNHNVLLELGYAIGRDRDVIILVHTPNVKTGFFQNPPNPLEGFPSDLNSIRRIQYTDMHDLEQKLLQAIDNLVREIHVDQQFWVHLRNFLKDGSQDTKSISVFMENKLDFSYQMTRNRLQRLAEKGSVTKRKVGQAAVYELNRSALQ